MGRRPLSLTALTLFFFLIVVQQVFAQSLGLSSFRPGLRFEYVARTIGWDEDKTSNLAAYLATVVLECKIREDLTLAGLVGYSYSNFDGLVFRRLPLSIAVPDSGVSGVLLGGEISWNFLSLKTLQVGAFGQFLASLGLKKTWDIPGLSVPGSVKAQPTWMRLSFGPVLSYKVGQGYVIYFHPSYNSLWGTFSLEEKVETLEGKEEKEIKGESQIGMALGSMLSLAENFRIKAEFGLYPFKSSTDFSILLQVLYVF